MTDYTIVQTLLAQAWEEGYDAGVEDKRDNNLERIAKNPYRENPKTSPGWDRPHL